MRGLLIALGLFTAVLLPALSHAAALEHNGKDFGWQDREFFGPGYVEVQIGAGDAAGCAE